MARTPSNTDLPLGTVCPAFELNDVTTGKAVGRDDIFGGPDEEMADGGNRSGLLVAFISVHCPFVQHMQDAFSALTAKYADRIATVAICSSDTAVEPGDAPDKMVAQAAALGWQFPYLFDASQEAAREFHAACTPDLYLFNAQYELVYHGQFDGTRPYRQSDANRGEPQDPTIHAAADGKSLQAAFDALLSNQPPLQPQLPGLGCNIKWREDAA